MEYDGCTGRYACEYGTGRHDVWRHAVWHVTGEDKIGRKNVILICVTLFSGFTFWGGFASNPTEFGILRFIAGLGDLAGYCLKLSYL